MDLMMVAGEASGDAHGAELILALRREHPELRFFGCGGEQMAAAGCELLVSNTELAVMGLFEVVRHLSRLRHLLHRLRTAMLARRPAAVILIDFPDFNLRLAAVARRAGIPVLYFISPQVWAWRSGRIRQIRRDVQRLISIIPFEPAFYERHGMEVAYVGHPLVERVARARAGLPAPAEFRHSLGLDAAAELVALLPGSRRRELHYHLPVLCETARRLHAERHVEFLLPVAPTLSLDEVRDAIPPPLRACIHLLPSSLMSAAVAHARLALVASGTATLETALLGTPLVVFYRLSPLTSLLGRRLVRLPHVSLVNLIAERSVVPELLQGDCNPDNLLSWAHRLLPDGDERSAMLEGLKEVAARCGSPGAIARAAAEVAAVLHLPSATPAPAIP
ncbi:MAG TPA: lipid-A-disaccharide synthase [Terriglobales bacterium]|nr:lipid-A-disaccharide synthase [Terriglobales bacterium]